MLNHTVASGRLTKEYGTYRIEKAAILRRHDEHVGHLLGLLLLRLRHVIEVLEVDDIGALVGAFARLLLVEEQLPLGQDAVAPLPVVQVREPATTHPLQVAGLLELVVALRVRDFLGGTRDRG